MKKMKLSEVKNLVFFSLDRNKKKYLKINTAAKRYHSACLNIEEDRLVHLHNQSHVTIDIKGLDKLKEISIKSCIDKANESGIKIYGDLIFRGKCDVEDQELINFFSWVRYTYPEYKNLIFHPENEMIVNGSSSFSYHAKSKAKGRIDGLPDIICLPIEKGSKAFCCELKRKNISDSLKSKNSKIHFLNQINILKDHQNQGAFCCVALGFEAAKIAFNQYIKESKI